MFEHPRARWCHTHHRAEAMRTRCMHVHGGHGSAKDRRPKTKEADQRECDESPDSHMKSIAHKATRSDGSMLLRGRLNVVGTRIRGAFAAEKLVHILRLHSVDTKIILR